MIPQRNLALLSKSPGPRRRAAHTGRRPGKGLLPGVVSDRAFADAATGAAGVQGRDSAIKRCYFGDYRFSEDLDFTLTAEVPFDLIRQELDPVFAEVSRSGGVSIASPRGQAGPPE